MHTIAMADTEGDFDVWKGTEGTCYKCGHGPIRFRCWESSCGGFEDYQYRCDTCGYSWWVDGPDA